jgi:4-alpha-glucanotransferase
LLLHVTSLPARHGIGDFGAEARRFVDFLSEAGQHYWQVLPLHPTTLAAGSSPYGALSAFALDPLLIDLGALASPDVPRFPDGTVDYPVVTAFKSGCLDDATELPGLEEFGRQHATWLEDFALFVALREENGERSWTDWPDELRDREPSALAAARGRLADRIRRHVRVQHLAFHQWEELRGYAAERGVEVIGDIPFYVSHDSADVWVHRDCFKLDESGRPTHLAGCPPDYYSETGQLWNSPVYRWDALADLGFAWWTERLRHALEMFDRVRIDHFRGFESHWEVPATESTAENGVWVPGPGAAPFEAARREGGELSIIAEDLGVITDEVRALRDRLGFPGMRVLQFAFDETYPESVHLPQHHVPRCVVYTGTHDNNTARGWLEHDATDEVRQNLEHHVGRTVTPDDISETLVELASASVAETVILPVQDVLGLDAAARMNVPSTPSGNWRFRLRPGQLDAATARRLRELGRKTGRC